MQYIKSLMPSKVSVNNKLEFSVNENIFNIFKDLQPLKVFFMLITEEILKFDILIYCILSQL